MATKSQHEQLMEAIATLTTAVTTLVSAPAPTIETVVPVAATTTAKPVIPEFDKAYVSHMANKKCQAYADKNSEQVVLYARNNAKGEHKLAYCLASKFENLKDRGLIGAIQVINPS